MHAHVILSLYLLLQSACICTTRKSYPIAWHLVHLLYSPTGGFCLSHSQQECEVSWANFEEMPSADYSIRSLCTLIIYSQVIYRPGENTILHSKISLPIINKVLS